MKNNDKTNNISIKISGLEIDPNNVNSFKVENLTIDVATGAKFASTVYSSFQSIINSPISDKILKIVNRAFDIKNSNYNDEDSDEFESFISEDKKEESLN